MGEVVTDELDKQLDMIDFVSAMRVQNEVPGYGSERIVEIRLKLEDKAKQAIKALIAKAVVEAYKKGVKDGWKESGEGYNYEYAGLSTIDPDKVGDDIAERLAKQLNTDKEVV